MTSRSLPPIRTRRPRRLSPGASGHPSWPSCRRTWVLGSCWAIGAWTQVLAEHASAPGPMVTFESMPQEGNGTSPTSDSRDARIVALYVPEGAPPTPFLPPGPFRATWEADLTLKLRGDYAFAAAGRGALTVTLNGETALEASGDDLTHIPGKAVRLNKGPNRLVARYQSPASGDAWVRLYWSSDEIPAEPVPLAALSHDPDTPALVSARRLREGREIFAAGRCVRCHGAEARLPPAAMPEVDMDAPSLADAGARFEPEWVERWILDPRGARPDAAMPALPLSPAEARDIAAYLATLGAGGSGPVQFPAPEAAAVGGRLYARLGCVACHTLPDHADPATAGDRVPLRHLRAKWKPRALQEYLRRPEASYAWTRMPDFRLTDGEAAQLAAFLLSRPVPAAPAKSTGAAPVPVGTNDHAPPHASAGDPVRGRALFASSGCSQCHRVSGAAPLHPECVTASRGAAPPARPPAMADRTRGCLADGAGARGRAPDFGWTEPQRQALRAFLAGDRSSLGRESLPEFAARQFRTLRCAACHRRDGEDDAWTRLEGEAEPLLAAAPPEPPEVEARHRVDQTRPTLTWAGEKLKPEWTASFLAGEVSYKPRPWLRARMPSFPARAALLARGLALDHGCPPASPPETAADPALAAIGRRLSGKNGGFGCVSCHHIGGAAAVGVFEVMGVNFMHVAERLRKEHYHRWLRNPTRVEPGTKMPQFSNDAGRTPYREFFEGDAQRQYEAIWHYLLAGEGIAAPEP